MIRAARHGLVTTALVVVVCLAVSLVSLFSYLRASAEINTLTARAQGHLTAVDGRTVTASWNLPDGAKATARVLLAATPPKIGTATEIAYQPGNPAHAVIPGASLLADADGALNGLIFSGLVAVVVLLVSAWRVISRRRVFGGPATSALVRRVRVQRGLLTRSWLEAGSRWIPVYFDPVLVTLPSPGEVTLYGSGRLVGVEVDGVRLYPSGPVVTREPRGRRGDNAVRPDEHATERARMASRLRRQFRVDSASLIPAPIVGVFWVFLTGGDFSAFVGATALAGVLALWLAAFRGSDPS